MIYLLLGLAIASLSIALYSAFLSRSLRRPGAPSPPAFEPIRAEEFDGLFGSGQLSMLYQTLFEECGAAALLMDASGRILRANVTAAQLLQIPAADLSGRSLLEASLSSDLHRVVQTAIQEDRALRQDVCIATRAGGRCLSVAARPLDGSCDPFRVLLLAHDITDLRRLETIRQDFVANVSHELRTPLASIRAMAETLQDGALCDVTVARRFLETIVTEAQRLTRISDDLLALSRAESQEPEMQSFDLRDLVCELVERIRPQAAKSSIALETHLPAGISVVASRDQVEQVLFNLIDNAIKYTPAGGRVDVIAEQSGEFACVRVVDTGIGILSSDLPRIFERFYRVDKARSRQSGGTGLGLAIVKHNVLDDGKANPMVGKSAWRANSIGELPSLSRFL